jgi:two-component system sensor histidine kinase YcbA
MNERLRNIEKILLVAIFTTFMGQIYVTPFGTNFRLTIAVMVLNVLMLTFLEIKPIPTINLVGIMMFSVRSIVYVYNQNGTILEAFSVYYPVIFFYLFYSFFFVVLNVRTLIKTPVSLFLGIWICDTIPNFVEIMVRGDWQGVNLEEAIYVIILIGLVRTLMTVILIYLTRYYYSFVKEREHHQKFVEKIILMSNLKTELFFLRKSKNDIEKAMQRSYEVYEQLNETLLKDSMLTVAKDIHEIKKDYSRVISGIEKSIEETPIYLMHFKEIMKIVKDANEKNAQSKDKSIRFQFSVNCDFKTPEFYALISILNNLITNAIDAIQTSGEIVVIGDFQSENLHLSISDNGTGIDELDMELIFEPGFSTKFNENNGIMASGIGLTHVKQLVRSFFGGDIKVESKKGEWTRFELWMPLSKLLEPHEFKTDTIMTGEV